jgi:hypothetical protein
MCSPDDPLRIIPGGDMDEMLAEGWPKYFAGVISCSEMCSPDDPPFIILGGDTAEMLAECWPECVAGVM